MFQYNKVYLHFYEPVFTWSHFLTKPLKWLIMGSTGSEVSHVSGSYTYARQGEYIKQATFAKGFHSVHYKLDFKKRHSRIWTYEIKVDIDFKILHESIKSHLGDKYHPPKAAYSAIDRIPLINKVWRHFFKIKLNDDKYDFCDKAWLLILQKQGYLKHINDVNSLNPEEFKKQIEKCGLCYAPRLTWNKSYFNNNVFINA